METRREVAERRRSEAHLVGRGLVIEARKV
jgi:hypothetical protein